MLVASHELEHPVRRMDLMVVLKMDVFHYPFFSIFFFHSLYCHLDVAICSCQAIGSPLLHPFPCCFFPSFVHLKICLSNLQSILDSLVDDFFTANPVFLAYLQKNMKASSLELNCIPSSGFIAVDISSIVGHDPIGNMLSISCSSAVCSPMSMSISENFLSPLLAVSSVS